MLDKQPIKTSISLDSASKVVNPNAIYLVDFSKMNSVNDLVLILSAMGISFSGSHPHFDVVKPFLSMDNPIELPQQQKQPPAEMKEIKLPKLKPVK